MEPEDNGHSVIITERDRPSFGLHAVPGTNIASEMIGQDDEIRQLFLSLSYFMDDNEAMIYCRALEKCDRHQLWNKKKYFLMRITAKVSIKGYRSQQVVDILTQIQRMEESTFEKLRKGKKDGAVQSTNI